MIRTISYNLPGYGFASCYLIGQAIDLMDMLEDAGVLEKMKNTCQLGTMKYIYPGAHHTRYEYVFTQLMLISNVISVENPQYAPVLLILVNMKNQDVRLAAEQRCNV